MKRISALLVLVLIAAAGVRAHDKGDLMLNIEPQVGAVLLPVAYSYMTPGMDLGLRTTAHYYFTDWFALNTGVGMGFNYHSFSELRTNAILVFVPIIGWLALAAQGLQSDIVNHGSLFAPYVTIPFGLRLSPGMFAFGLGTTVNIPIHINRIGSREREDVQIQSEGDYTQKGDVSYTMHTLPYMGWYVDIGFDSSGAKKQKNGFGLLFRLAGSFGDAFKLNPSRWYYDSPPRNSVLSFSLVMQFAIELAKLPIKSKK